MNVAENSSGQTGELKKESTAMARAPRLSAGALTLMLAAMCAIPAITMVLLWKYMPPAQEGKLKVTVERVGIPTDISYYEVKDVIERPDVSEGSLLLTNNSESEWRHIDIRLNKNYVIHDNGPIAAGSQRAYLLNRFVSRTGTRFDLRQIPLRHVLVFAKQVEQGNRATFTVEYPEMIKSR